MQLANFWLILLVVCLVWYSTMTAYVAVRAGWDIRNMLARLQAAQDEQPPPGGDDDAS